MLNYRIAFTNVAIFYDPIFFKMSNKRICNNRSFTNGVSRLKVSLFLISKPITGGFLKSIMIMPMKWVSRKLLKRALTLFLTLLIFLNSTNYLFIILINVCKTGFVLVLFHINFKAVRCGIFVSSMNFIFMS